MRGFIWKGFLVFPVLVAVGFLLLPTQSVSSQSVTQAVSTQSFGGARDPGVRGGAPGAGGALAGIQGTRLQRFFDAGREEFDEPDGEEVNEGLGPRMNLDRCGGCHSQPAIGGSSPADNPQVAFATKNGGTDSVPSFITPKGPVREARFVRNADGTPDGGVAALFTITGREGAGNCNIAQPDFATHLRNNNVIFRTPTPVFGAGLIEQIEDSEILRNLAANATQKSQLGIRGRANVSVSGRTISSVQISGVANRNGNDGTITRFGWKAQNVSLLIFSGEAYNVEMGITNELFQNEREQNPACYGAGVTVPNDVQNMDTDDAVEGTTAIQHFANFQRFLAPPTPVSSIPGGSRESVTRGRAQFTSTGCAYCHTPTLRTSNHSTIAALNNVNVNLFSDLLVHDMGVGLADGVTQGQAGPRDFRTAPLWGLGQRIFFLHDGRTKNLIEAIQAHQSSGSEANGVISKFNALGDTAKQDLLNFLRSL